MSVPGSDTGTSSSPRGETTRRPKVVVVEDDPEILDLESFLLSSEGLDVVPVSDGADAVATIVESAPDLVILDLMLPGRSGNEILADLEQEPRTADLPVIVVSAFVEKLAPSRLVRHVIAKPFDVSELLDGIARELAAR